MRNYYIILVLFFIPFISFSQFISATIGVDGLTCSLCSRSVEKSILRLDFVKEVQMDLNVVQAKIIFLENKITSFEQLANAVKEAGFSVRDTKAIFNFSSDNKPEDECWIFENEKYLILDYKDSPLTGQREITFLNDFSNSARAFKKYKRKFQELSIANENCNPRYFILL